jgi:Tol biopolymer transport system component
LFPFWSPDGREIGFFTTSQLQKFDLGSGTVQRVCPVDQARGGAWSEDGRIVFSRSFRGGLWIVDADGGEPSPLTELDRTMHTSHRWPFVVPGTRSFLFSAVSARIEQAEHNAVYIGSLDGDGPPRQLLRSDYRVEYHDGLLLHVRDGVLLASRADLDRAEMIGSPTVIVPALAADLSTWHGQFSASATGVLVFNRMTSTSDASAPVGYSWAVEGDRVSAFNYSGRLTTTHGTGLPILSMALSPDGFTLALSVVSEQGTPDIVLHPTAWVFDRDDPEVLDQQALAVLAPDVTRLTFLDDAEVAPVWSPGSDEVAFRWDGDADRPRGIYRKRLGGGSEVLVRDNKGEDDWPDDWTSDGKYLLIVKGSLISSEKNDLWAVSLEDGSEFPVVETPDPDRDPRVSPDGRWLAYTQRGVAGGRRPRPQVARLRRRRAHAALEPGRGRALLHHRRRQPRRRRRGHGSGPVLVRVAARALPDAVGHRAPVRRDARRQARSRSLHVPRQRRGVRRADRGHPELAETARRPGDAVSGRRASLATSCRVGRGRAPIASADVAQGSRRLSPRRRTSPPRPRRSARAAPRAGRDRRGRGRWSSGPGRSASSGPRSRRGCSRCPPAA